MSDIEVKKTVDERLWTMRNHDDTLQVNKHRSQLTQSDWLLTDNSLPQDLEPLTGRSIATSRG